MCGVPGLVTCGDADSVRYVISRAFVENARRKGVDVIWKSFPNHPHDVPPESLRLAREFLAFAIADRRKADAGESFVGDDQDGVYYSAFSAEAEFVSPLDRVLLPSRAIADAWGKPAFKPAELAAPEEIVRMTVSGVEFVCRVPRKYDADSRILVLFGGRGWPGAKTLKAFGFGAFADMEKVFLISPSFHGGEYWRPETGTGAALAKAVAELERRYGLKDRPVVLYGYSAGGQCAALFAQSKNLSVAAWGAHGCGVYPEGTVTNKAPALLTCGFGDEDRMRITRSFAMRYREEGGLALLKPFAGGHELGDGALGVAREWIRAVMAGGESWIWGEDDTMRIKDRDDIEVESRNPLYTRRLSEMWQE